MARLLVLLAALGAAEKLTLQSSAGDATIVNAGGTLSVSAPKCVDMSNFCDEELRNSECETEYEVPASSVEFASTAPSHTGSTAYVSLFDDGVLRFWFRPREEGYCVELRNEAQQLATRYSASNQLVLEGDDDSLAGMQLLESGNLRINHPGGITFGRLPCYDWEDATHQPSMSQGPANAGGSLPNCLQSDAAHSVGTCQYGENYACAPYRCTEWADDACTRDAARGARQCTQWSTQPGSRRNCSPGTPNEASCGAGKQCDEFTFHVKKCLSCV